VAEGEGGGVDEVERPVRRAVRAVVRTGLDEDHATAGLGEAGGERGLARRERGGHGRDTDRRTGPEGAAGSCDHGGIDADGGDGRAAQAAVIAVIRPQGLGAERGHLPGRVLALEGGEIDHRSRQFQTEDLGLSLDRTRAVFGDALLDTDGVDGADLVEKTAKGEGPDRAHGYSETVPPRRGENNGKLGNGGFRDAGRSNSVQNFLGVGLRLRT
jgi:hypothetical protein